MADGEEHSPGRLSMEATTTDGLARNAALETRGAADHALTSVVVYDSRGHLLVNSSEPLEPALAEKILETGLKCTFLVSREQFTDVVLKSGPGNADLLEGRITAFRGHLGDFRITLQRGDQTIDAGALLGNGERGFDLVLDLSGNRLESRDVLPVGYYAPDTEKKFDEALAEIPQMVGEFEKPKYFRLDPDSCAHTSRGVVACTRCLDVCPTLAITPGEESVVVDPYACQGIGICTTVCPTGAISYAYPRGSDLLDDLRRVLHRYHRGQGKRPALVFHTDVRGRDLLQRVISRLPENLIPIEVESVTALGIEIWLSCLAYGAHHVFLLVTGDSPPGVTEPMEKEIKVAAIILAAMGYPDDRITMLSTDVADELPELLPARIGKQLVTPAGFAGFDEKRTAIGLALDHFLEHAQRPVKSVSLPRGSCFGRVRVNRDDCTLCMSCVAVCPASALLSGGELPRLEFLERNCVQCGMCEKACPENAIELDARFDFDAQESGEARVVNEEDPFNCIKCGKSFSTQTMMTKIREKLSDHWMYQDESQIRRLEMCENCRVEDMYAAGGGLDPHGKLDGSENQ